MIIYIVGCLRHAAKLVWVFVEKNLQPLNDVGEVQTKKKGPSLNPDCRAAVYKKTKI